MKNTNLTNSDIRKLRQMSHTMGAYVIIGKNGLTDETLKLLDKELEYHELVKIRCNKFKEEKEEIATKLQEASKSLLISATGNVIVLYRRSKDEKRHIL